MKYFVFFGCLIMVAAFLLVGCQSDSADDDSTTSPDDSSNIGNPAPETSDDDDDSATGAEPDDDDDSTTGAQPDDDDDTTGSEPGGLNVPSGFSAVNPDELFDFGVGWTGIEVRLTDAPVDFAEAVYVAFSSISLHIAQTENPEYSNGDWVELTVAPDRFDLLQLQNNNQALLSALSDVPVGTYTEVLFQIDCSAGVAPAIVVGGNEIPISVPSGCENGLKLITPFELTEDDSSQFVLDFDIRKSLVDLGSGGYLLTPVLRWLDASEIGFISGAVTSADAEGVVVYAFESGDYNPSNPNTFDKAVNSTIVRDDGTYAVGALPAGTYDIVVTAEGYVTNDTAEGVVVSAESETVVPTINLEPDL